MASIKDIGSPAKMYKQAKDAYLSNVDEYFNNVIKESETNIDKNRETCDKYYEKLTETGNQEKSLRKLYRKRSWFNFLKIVCFITIILIPVGILINSNIKNKINKQIDEQNNSINKAREEAENFKQEAIKQTSLLNSMYDWNIASSMFTKTLPLIELDKQFDVRRFFQMHDKYGYKEHTDNDISTVFVQSGTIQGNPFVLEKNYVCEIANHIYTGSLVIHWVTTSTDSEGHVRTHHHTQTLIAHVTKPRPFHYLDTWLVYGNDAAPKLKFSRAPTNTKGMDEKAIARLSKRTEKALTKKTEKDINFTQMANSKFEGLFKAFDRNNEVEFRLLFTPLAQSNMIDLITMNEPYGDDFFFYKKEQLNYIKTAHSQSFDYSSNPNTFIDFDISKSKEKITNYASQYFDSLYFDLAPLLSIPLYQNNKAREYIYKDNANNRITGFEVESLVNNYDKSLFKPKESYTDVILKSRFVKRDGDADLVNIEAFGFKTIPHTEIVPTLGGDGRIHPVPVIWYEYIPVKKSTPIIVKHIGGSRYEFNSKENKNVFTNKNINNVYYQKGLVSALINK